MKVFANTAMMVGAVVLMGWLMLAQRAYQRGWSESPTVQSSVANETDLATSLDRAALAMK